MKTPHTNFEILVLFMKNKYVCYDDKTISLNNQIPILWPKMFLCNVVMILQILR